MNMKVYVFKDMSVHYSTTDGCFSCTLRYQFIDFVGVHHDVVSTFVTLLVSSFTPRYLFQQRLPVRVTEVVEFGSLGSGTSTSSRMDVDLIVYSPGECNVYALMVSVFV